MMEIILLISSLFLLFFVLAMYVAAFFLIFIITSLFRFLFSKDQK